MTVALAIVGGVLAGVAIVALMGLTAPWWIPILDPFMQRWGDWIDRKIEARKKAQ